MNQKPQKTTKSIGRTKAEKIIALLRRDTGATIAELAKVTGWRRHSVRGFLSATLKKKRAMQTSSNKVEKKDWRYGIRAGAK